MKNIKQSFRKIQKPLSALVVIIVIVLLNPDKLTDLTFKASIHILLQSLFMYGLLAYLQKYKILHIAFALFVATSLFAVLTYGSFFSAGIIMSVFGTSLNETYDFIESNFADLVISILLLLGMIFLPTSKRNKIHVFFLSIGSLYILLPAVYNFKNIEYSEDYKDYMETGVARGLSRLQTETEYVVIKDMGNRFPPLKSIRGITDTVNFLSTMSEASSSSWTEVTAKKGSPNLLIIGIGESLRADHLGIYGYERNTTPHLSHMKDKLFVYKDAYSGGTNTWTSIPAMFTKFSTRPDLSKSIIHLANDAGYETYWLSNQTKLGKWDFAVSSIASQSDHTFFITNEDDHKIKYDGALLPKLFNILKEKNPDKKTLIILHFYGSHMLFKDRYPANYSKFHSESTIIDQYDNTVLYTDYILSQILNMGSKYNAEFLFFSDHALGDPNGEIPLLHDVRQEPHTDSLNVPFISNDDLHLNADKPINLFYFECIFSTWSGISAKELNSDYCTKGLDDKRIIYYDANLILHKVENQDDTTSQ